jgi:hypothetical protein
MFNERIGNRAVSQKLDQLCNDFRECDALEVISSLQEVMAESWRLSVGRIHPGSSSWSHSWEGEMDYQDSPNI